MYQRCISDVSTAEAPIRPWGYAMGWKPTGQPTVRKQRDKWVVRVDGIDTVAIDGVIHYEERMLFALNLLRHPRARLVYLTSAPIHPAAVDYMLSLVSGIPTEHMRRRLTVISLYDSSLIPLSEKILQRPRVIERIKHLIRPECGLMTCFTVSNAERRLAVALGIPLYGVDPELSWLGTKSGSRAVFREAGIPLPPGFEDIRDEVRGNVMTDEQMLASATRTRELVIAMDPDRLRPDGGTEAATPVAGNTQSR